MTGTPRIVSLEPGISADEGAAEIDHGSEETGGWVAQSDDAGDAPPWDASEEPARVSRREGMTPLLVAGGVIALWTIFFAWANSGAFGGGGTTAAWADRLVMWSVPVLLVLTVLHLVLRSSRREAVRFTDIARTLSEESARLENRLVTVNGELSLAREFVAAQSRDLEALGRVATERLSQNADRLAALIQGNSTRIEQIATVSASALENMDKLRAQLPVIANTAKDVTNNIGSAGRTAHAQLQELASGFHRLNEFGMASERQVATVRAQVDAAVETFTRQAEDLGVIATERFAALTAEGDAYRQRLDAEEIAALAAIRGRAAALAEELALASAETERAGAGSAEALRARIAALRDEGTTVAAGLREAESAAVAAWRERLAALTEHSRETRETIVRLDSEAAAAAAARVADVAATAEQLHASIAARSGELGSEIMNRRAELEIAGRSAIEALRSRFAEIDAAIQAQRERHLAQSHEVAEQTAQIGARLELFGETLGGIGTHGDEVAARLDQGLAVLSAKLLESREALNGTDATLAALTEGGTRLLALIEASAEHTREQLPEAISGTENRLKGIGEQVFMLRDALGAASASGQALSDYVHTARSGVGEASAELAAFKGGLDEASGEHRARIAAIREEIAQARGESDALAGQIEARLHDAIGRLTAAARETAEAIGGTSDTAIDAVAARLGDRSAIAIEQAVTAQTREAIAKLEAAVTNAVAASRDAAVQLRDQLTRVDELAGNLERRVSHARARAEEQVDSDFARRVALITESLNSAAIDIAKALSADVTDTAWAAYLRGDRGIFTRRAVTLLDGTDARAVAQHYEGDHEFRENVNHYIHDFEAMLRNLLSTRDGNALGVTLLSSDMGKLYVALAQGIERLRT